MTGVTPSAPPRMPLRKIVVSSTLSSAIEWYDFFIYGTAAALVFNSLFFPSVDPIVGTLLSFATFGVGFMARPVGAVIFGHFGDRVGRKKMLVIAIFLMAISTTLIGLLPTYSKIGVLAPILLVVLRLIQGVAVGGQFGGAVLIATENAAEHRRGFYGSLAQLGPPVGLVASTASFLLITELTSPEQLESWGWRIPFLLSISLTVIGLYAHFQLEETEDGKAAARAGEVSRFPILDVLRNHPLNVFVGAGTVLTTGVGFYLFSVYVISYGKQQNIAYNTLLVAVIVSACLQVPAILAFGRLSDRLGRPTVFLGGVVGLAAWAFPVFLLVNTGRFAAIVFALVVAQVCVAAIQGPLPSLMHELFPAHLRYSGVSLGYQIGATVGGGLSPLAAAALFGRFGSFVPISVMLVFSALTTAVCIIIGKQNIKRGSAATPAAEKELTSN
ncbi:MFS transporter [Rhodococcus sp. WS4]|nr:MFS transporter [Rhodococcus sp. WS4]